MLGPQDGTAQQEPVAQQNGRGVAGAGARLQQGPGRGGGGGAGAQAVQRDDGVVMAGPLRRYKAQAVQLQRQLALLGKEMEVGGRAA